MQHDRSRQLGQARPQGPHSASGSTRTTTLPFARPVMMRSYALSVSSNANTLSTTGRTLPGAGGVSAASWLTGKRRRQRTFLHEPRNVLQPLARVLHPYDLHRTPGAAERARPQERVPHEPRGLERAAERDRRRRADVRVHRVRRRERRARDVQRGVDEPDGVENRVEARRGRVGGQRGLQWLLCIVDKLCGWMSVLSVQRKGRRNSRGPRQARARTPRSCPTRSPRR
jgi:hypothetical protein